MSLMPPTTRNHAKCLRWQKLRLPPEILELILIDLVRDHIHEVLYEGKGRYRRVKGDPKRMKKSQKRDIIISLLRVSRQCRAITARLLTILFEIQVDEDGIATEDLYGTRDPIKQALKRFDMIEFVCCNTREDGHTTSSMGPLHHISHADPHIFKTAVAQVYGLASELYGPLNHYVPLENFPAHVSGDYEYHGLKGPSNETAYQLLLRGFETVIFQKLQVTFQHVLEVLTIIYDGVKSLPVLPMAWRYFVDHMTPSFKKHLSKRMDIWLEEAAQFGIKLDKSRPVTLSAEQGQGIGIAQAVLYLFVAAEVWDPVTHEALELCQLIDLVQETFGVHGSDPLLRNSILAMA